MRTQNISQQLAVWVVVTGAVTVLAFAALNFFHQQSNAEVSQLNQQGLSAQKRCYQLSRVLGRVDETVQELLRTKDPDDLERKLKDLEACQAKALKLIETCGPEGNEIKAGFLKLVGVEKAVTDRLLLGDLGGAWSRFIEASTPQYELVIAKLDQYSQQTQRTIEAQVQSSEIRRHRYLIFQASTIGVLILGTMVLGWVIRRKIVIQLTHIYSSLATTGTTLLNSSTQISKASQLVADGASEQAAAIEQTSSALEALGSITAKTASSAETAKSMASDTKVAAETGFDNMREMSSALDAIEASSVNISKIIKTIDEIAFQTNILALNAAVEAARAGEAGLGFAVVADEVRNLAVRSAQAAKETSEKIEDSIQKSRNGLMFRDKVTGNLTEIVGKARQMDELVAVIANVSAEQKQGIEQITAAVSQMDKVTQSNAATAEQCAEASEQQKAQADELNKIVITVRQLVDSANPTQAIQVARPTGL